MIRRLTAKDRRSFLEMAAEFYHSEAVLTPIPEAYHLATFRELMRSDAYLECYLLEDGGKTAGYALLSKSFSQEAGGKVVWLEELFIRPEFRGKGLGGEFLQFLEREIPAARYRLEAEPENRSAIAMYKRQGYSVLPYVQMIKE